MSAAAAAVAGSGVRGFVDGPAGAARFHDPSGVAVAPDGGYFVADQGNHAVRRVAPDGAVTTVAGTGAKGVTDGPGAVATFSWPYGIAVDRKFDVFVAESGAGRVRRLARRRDGGWVVSTVVAKGLNNPMGIAVDPSGRLVVANRGNHRVVRVDPASGALAVIAGDGTEGSRDGPGATARFNRPAGVAVDRRGHIFVTEGSGRRVRRISAVDGSVTTVAGTGDHRRADGMGAAASFGYPRAVAVDGRGVLIVADGVAHASSRLRRIAASADRSVTTVTVAGDALDKLGFIGGIAIDRDGSLLVALPDRHRIVRVTGLGLAPPAAPAWSLRAHRGLAAAAPGVATFVTTVMLCALRLDATYSRASGATVPRLPVEMWLAILSILRPDQMLRRR